MQAYEFHTYSATPEGDLSREPIRIDRLTCYDAATAKSVARKMAKAEQGPVDVALAGPSPWADRYLGTATPKYPYSDCKITVFERLS